MRKIEKTIYIDTEGREFDTPEECRLSDLRVRIAHFFERKEFKLKTSSRISKEVTERNFHEYFNGLDWNEIQLFQDYLTALVTAKTTKYDNA